MTSLASVVTSGLLVALVVSSTPTTILAQKGGEDANALRATARTAIQNGNFAKAEEAAAKALKINDNDPVAWYQIGYARHALKKYDEALKAHLRAASMDNPQTKILGTYNAACVYALRNEKDKAFKWLKKSVEVGFNRVGTIRNDTDMDNLREDPRFAKIVAAVADASRNVPSRAFPSTTSRQNSRVAYFGQGGATGQFAFDYSPIAWKDRYSGMLDSEQFVGRRWRFGANFWTNLDTNVPMMIGGAAIEPGVYYLTLTYKGKGKLVMTAIPSADVRKARLDASAAASTTGGIEIPMKHKTVEDDAQSLSIAAKMDTGDNTNGKVVVRFGPHAMMAPIQVHLNGRPSKKDKKASKGY